jgi:DNA-binding NtrC family response regulator
MNPTGSSPRILVVDDAPDMLDICVETLNEVTPEIATESNGQRAWERVREEPFDLMVCDIRMGGMDGVTLLRQVKEHDPTLPVIMLTGHPTIDTAVECLKLGAADYITKPVHPDDLLVRARRCLDERRLREENSLLRKHVEKGYQALDLVGGSPAMQGVHDLIERVAPTDVDVLIHGETGTGKELVARAIHNGSRRRGRPFVPVDCGAIPENLLESEFFGYEKGAFTGAAQRSIGLLEFAQGGTVFLDELGELPLLLQSKLLRALQERRIRRLGGKVEVPVDTRIVAATGRDLERMIQRGEFRQDLYFRINVVTIPLPPLRDRGDDPAVLADHFRVRYAKEAGKPVQGFTPAAEAAIKAYRWPGNVRELQNVVRRGIALCRGERIGVEDLPPQITGGSTSASRPPMVTNCEGTYAETRAKWIASFEREYLAGLLRAHHGDVVAAAGQAGLSRASFYRMMKANNLRASTFRADGQEPPPPPDGE